MKSKMVVGGLLMLVTGCSSVPKLAEYEGPVHHRVHPPLFER
jgi:hypothetical protein